MLMPSIMSHRWLIVAQRDHARSAAAQVWVCAQDVGAAQKTGAWLRVPGTAGASRRFPSIAGVDWDSGNARPAIIVYQEDPVIPAQNTASSSILAVQFDWIQESCRAPFAGAPGGQDDNERPSIVRQAATSIDNVVAWQRRTDPSGRWTVMVGALAASCIGCCTPTVTTTGLLTPGTDLALRPVVGGVDGRYLVAFARREQLPSVPTPDGSGHAIDVQRVDVRSVAGRVITLGPRRTIADATDLERSTTGSGSRGIGHDPRTSSQWVVGYTVDDQSLGGTRAAHVVRVVRVDHSGGVTERAVLQQSQTSDAFGPVCAETLAGANHAPGRDREPDSSTRHRPPPARRAAIRRREGLPARRGCRFHLLRGRGTMLRCCVPRSPSCPRP